MTRPGLNLLSYACTLGIAQGLPRPQAEGCPTGAPGPGSSLPGWDLSNLLYVSYNQTQPSGQATTTAHITFDLVGAFSNRLFHCEATGPDLLTGSSWKTCATEDTATAAKYTTSFKYNPNDWDTLTLREMSSCGPDPQQLSTILFKGVATRSYFVTNSGSPPDPPTNGSTVETWSNTYYSSYHVPGQFTLIPPPPSLTCTTANSSNSGWEIDDFTFTPSSPTVGLPWTLPQAGYTISFGARNLINNYSVWCSYFHSVLAAAPDPPRQYCGTVDPEDAPFSPATLFHVDWDTHILQVNQSWNCNGQGDNSGSYSGYGSVYVPWDCDQIILPNTTGCKTQPPSKIFVQQR